MKLIVLASGRGTRLKKNTKKFPKCKTIINNNRIIDYYDKIYNLFDEVIFVVGYKSKLIINYIKKKKIKHSKFVNNKKFISTNMVESLFLTKKYINDDIIVIYSDIIFDEKIIEQLIKQKQSCLPLNNNWLNLWKKRMKNKMIKFDAEQVITYKKKIVAIGQQIKGRLPKLQYMGIIRIQKKDFFKMYKLYNKLNNKKIDMTSFLNKFVMHKKNSLNFFSTKKYWFEIDTIADLNHTRKKLNIN